MIKSIPVKPNEYKQVICTCGRAILVWYGETVRHVPFTRNCSEYAGVEEKEPEQASLFEVEE